MGGRVCWLWSSLLIGAVACQAGGSKNPNESVLVRQAALVVGHATRISAGLNHSCVRLADGRVACWGYGQFGQLGNASNNESDRPVLVSGLADATDVSAAGQHGCAVRAGGQVVCWGSGLSGVLGNGSIDSSNTPVTVSSLFDATAISAGNEHSCALRAGGRVACWGARGQLGDGLSAPSSTPVEVAGLMDATQISAGVAHTCARRATGVVVCWGSGSSGQLGNGALAAAPAPVAVTGLDDAVAVEAGSSHTCAIRAEGTIACWGANTFGQLGNGSQASSTTPVPVSGLDDIVALSLGTRHTCALAATGIASCWGFGGDGQLGSSFAGSLVPRAASGLSNGAAIDAGAFHTCAIRTTGEVVCFGRGENGELGSGSEAGSMTPVRVSTIADAVQVEAGDAHTCATLSDGHVLCWGDGRSGRLGNGSDLGSPSPVTVVGLTNAVKVAAGSFGSCARRADGGVSCWGFGEDGRLGNGANLSSSSPVTVVDLVDAEALATDPHSCARRATGQVVCWGRNVSGMLGNGTFTSSNVPVLVSGLGDAVDVATGILHSCATRASGDVACWGFGSQGQLGNGLASGSNVAVTVSALADAVQVAAGGSQSCARRTSGQISCWGGAFDGRQFPESVTPAAVPGVSDAIDVTAGEYHACALRGDGSVACWGSGADGRLGNGGTTYSAAAVAVAGLPAPAVSVSAGRLHTCAVVEPGHVYCWGGGLSGQLGNGLSAVSPSAAPVPVFGLSDNLGAACASGADCLSGFCVDGVCCDSACGGGDPTDCQACSGASADGSCSLLSSTHACYTAAAFCEADQVCSGSSPACPLPALPPEECTAAINDPGVCDGEPACVELLGGTDTEGGIEVTFFEPYTGEVRVEASGVGCPPPTGFEILRFGDEHGDGTYFDITADPPSGLPQMRICFHYPQGTMPEGGSTEQGLRIAHGTSAACSGPGDWTELIEAEPPDQPDMVNNIICGNTDSLSPFAIIAPLDVEGPAVSNVPATIIAYATSTAGATVSYVNPTATDAIDGPRPVTCAPASGTKFAPGKKTVTCTSSDLRGNTTSATFTVWVQYQSANASFFLKPPRDTGSSIFRIGRPVPVKFQLGGASKNITNLQSHLVVTKISDSVQGSVDDECDEDDDDTDFLFKYRPGQKLYVYRWKTRGETPGSYRLRADLGDDVVHEVIISLKRQR